MARRQTPDDVRFISASDAAQIFGYTRDYVAILARTGKVRAKRVGRKWYVSEPDLRKFFIEQTQTQESLKRSLSHEYRRIHSGSAAQSALVEKFAARYEEKRSPRHVAVPADDVVSHETELAQVAPRHGVDRLVALSLTLLLLFGAYSLTNSRIVDSVAHTAATAVHRPSQLADAAAVATFVRSTIDGIHSLLTGFVLEAQNSSLGNASVQASVTELQGQSQPQSSVLAVALAPKATTTPAPSSSTRPLATTVVNQPVIERTVETEKIITLGGITQDELTAQLQQLGNKLSSQMYSLTAQNSTAISQNYAVTAQTNAIDELNGTHIKNSTITGGSITTTSVSATSLSVSGDTTLAGNLTLSSTSSSITATNFSITNATTTNLFATTTTVVNASTTYLTALDSTTTNSTSTNLYSSSLIAGNATSTNLFATLGTFTNSVIGNLTSTLATITGLTVTNSTTTNATTTNAYIAAASIATASTTNLTWLSATGTNSILTNATSTNLYSSSLIAGNATTTNLFATTASSTNLFSTTGAIGTLSLGTLSVSNLATFGSGLLAQASTTLGNGTQTGGLTVNGGATTTLNQYIGGNLTVGGNSTVIGNSTSNLLTINSSVNSHLIPNGNKIFDLGSPSYYWRTGYIDTITTNSISAASTTIGGTNSQTFTINAQNGTADTQDMSLIFFRGTVVPNAVITWNSATKRFEFNQASYFQNQSGSTTQDSFTIKGVAGQTGNLLTIASSSGATLFSVGASGATTIGGSLTVNGSLTTTQQASTTLFSSLGPAYFGSSATTTIDQAGNVNIAGTLHTTGNTTLTNATSTNLFSTTASSTNLFSTTGAVGTLSLGTLTVSGAATFTGSSLSLNTASTSQLSVFQKAYFGGTATTTIDAGGNIVGAGTLTLSGNTGTTTIASGQGFTVGGNQLVVDPWNGNVGIGSSTPQYNLAIASQTGNASLAIQSAGLSFYPALKFLQGTSAFWETGVDTSQNFYLNPAVGSGSTGAALYLTHTGNVGVGTTNPLSKLDVNGGAAIGSYAGTSAAPSNGLIVSGNVGVGTTSPMDLFSVAGNEYISGNSGIGVRPSSAIKLFVTQDSVNTVGLSLRSQGLSTDRNPTMQFCDNASHCNYFGMSTTTGSLLLGGYTGNTDSASSMVITTGGNVGIGTTTPRSLLSIGAYGTGALSEANVAMIANNTGETLGLIGSATAANLNFYQEATTTRKAVVRAATGGSGSGGVLSLWTASDSGTITQRLTVDQSGNVGIGTTNPRGKLDVVSSGTPNISGEAIDAGVFTGPNKSLTQAQGPLGNLTIQTNDAQGAGVGGTLAFGGLYRAAQNDAANYAAIKGAKENGTDATIAGYLAFSTRNQSSGSAERMRIDSSGNVGIGTTTPSGKFAVTTGVNSDATQVKFLSEGSTSGDWNEIMLGGAEANYKSAILRYYNGAGTAANSKLEIFHYGDSAGAGLNIVGGGNVGIGTTSPSSALSVVGDIDLSTRIKFKTATGDSGNAAIFGLNAPVGGKKFEFYDYASSTALMVINDATGGGNVGIGTTTPAGKLDVVSSGDTYLNIITSSTGGGAGLSLFAGSSNNPFISYNGALRFGTQTAYNAGGFSEKMRIDNSGNVGIGTAGPTAALNVKGPQTDSSLTSGSSDVFTMNANGSSVELAYGLALSSPYYPWIQSRNGGAASGLSLNPLGGNVGINTASPSEELTIGGSSPVIKFVGTGGSNSFGIAANDGTGIRFYDFNNSANRLTISNTGNVGIGNTAPVAHDSGAHATVQVGNSLILQDVVGTQTMFSRNAYYDGAWKYANNGYASAIRMNDDPGDGSISFYNAPSGTAGATITNWDGANKVMTIRNGGNVGIGISNPIQQVTVNGTGTTTANMVTATSMGGTLLLADTAGAPGNGGALIFGAGGGSWNFAAIKGNVTNGAGSSQGDITFSTRPNATDGTLTEAARITSSGNVGIGTVPNSLAKMEVAVASGQHVWTRQSFLDGNTSGVAFQFLNDNVGSANIIGEIVAGASALKLQGAPVAIYNSSGTEKYRFDTATGNFGIGTAGPAARLDVVTAGGGHLYTSDYGCGAFGGLGGSATFTGCANYALLTAGGDTFINAPSSYSIRFRNANAEKMIINPSGNVGIGTTSPAEKLDVNGAAAVRGGTASFATASNVGMLDFPDSSTGARVLSFGPNTSTYSPIRFYQAKANNTGGYYPMMIDSSGNVGIGTPSPFSILHVSATSPQFTMQSSNGTGGMIQDSGTGNSVYVADLGAITFKTGVTWNGNWLTSGTEQMRIANNGNVGIGVSPSYKLDVNGGAINAGSGSYLRLSSATGGSSGEYWIGRGGIFGGSTAMYAPAGQGLEFGIANSAKMVMDGNGNVGIGTTNPQNYKLAIVGPSIGTAAGSLQLVTPSAVQGEKSAVSFYSTFQGTADNGARRTADVIAGFNGGAWGNEYLAFDVGTGGANDTQSVTTERMRITGGGNVGVGTTNPAAKLDVRGEFKVVNSDWVTGSAGSGLNIITGASSGSTYTGINAYTSGAAGAGNLILNGAAGNVGIGTTGPGAKLEVYNGDILLHGGTGGNSNKITFQTTDNGDTNKYIDTESYYMILHSHGNEGWKFNDTAGTQMIVTGGTNAHGLLAGAVGIGTASPNEKLDVNGKIRIGADANGTGNAYLDFQRDSDNWQTARILANFGGSGYLGQLNFMTNTGGSLSTLATAMTITGPGNVGIGTVSPVAHDASAHATVQIGNNYVLQDVVGTQTSIANNAYYSAGGWKNINTDNSSAIRMFSGEIRFENTGSNAAGSTLTNWDGTGIGGIVGKFDLGGNFTVYGSGTTCTIGNGTGATSCTSDQRLKTNITAIPGADALAGLAKIRGVTFNWADPKRPQAQQVGVIAQDVLQAFPQVVSTATTSFMGTDGTYYTVDYAALVSPLISGVNELNRRTEFLASTTTLADLESATSTASSTPAWLSDLAANASSTAQVLASYQAQFDALVGSTTDSTSSPQVASFASAFWQQVFAQIGKWLANAGNGIHDLYASVIHAQEVHSKELCASKTDGSEVCVTGDQLAVLLAGQTASAAVSSGATSGGAATTTPSTATSTTPVLAVQGDNPATVAIGSVYADLGATITGPVADLNLGISASVDGATSTAMANITIDTTALGTHTITYSATDQAGNTGTATRTVVVSSPSTAASITQPTATTSATTTTTTAASTSTATSTTP